MYVLCMKLYIILNNTVHRGRTKIEIKNKRQERQKYKYFNASCLTCFFTFEIDTAGKYLSPNSLL